MFSHVTVGVSDFDRAMAFYKPVCAALGFSHRFTDSLNGRRWAGWELPGGGRPLFIVTEPFVGKRQPANGGMVAFLAESRVQVDRVYALAMAFGGADEGGPGLRPQYHADYYAAYFRDLDGNKLCVVCHAPDPAA